MLKLDVKDKKIIYHLNENSRISLTALAKKVQLKKETVNYRLQRLIRNELISFQTFLDFTFLGQTYYYVLFKFKSFDLLQQKKVFDSLNKHPNFVWVAATHGSWDILTQAYVRDISELDAIIGHALEDLKEALLDYTIVNGIKEFIYSIVPGSLFDGIVKDRKHLSAVSRKFVVDLAHKPLVEIDNTDKKILSLISDNSRLHLLDVAKKIGVSNDTVNYRIKSLEKKGVIVGYTILLDRHKLGYLNFLLLLKVSNLNGIDESRIIQFLLDLRNATYAAKCSGDFNIIVEFSVKTIEELSENTLRLRGFFGDSLQHLDSLTYFKIIKFRYSVDIL